MGQDDDKTVFGQPLPGARPASGDGHRRPPASQVPPADDKTVFGQQLPPGRGAGRSGPAGSGPGYSPGVDDTWVDGLRNPQPGQPTAPGYGGRNPEPQPIYRPGTGRRAEGAEIFPEIPQAARPETVRQRPRITLESALRATGLGAGGPSNPLVAAAANLLILLGRLRTGLVEMQAGPLIDHVTREIDQFERNALASGVPGDDARDAKYALCATADDIVQNLPGADRGMWLEYAMIARFFGERSSGVGFFQKMDEAMKAPGQRYNLLELMLICLSLGFEGQYRAMPNGVVELSRIRMAIYETLRRINPRPDDDIAVHWTAVPMNGKRRRSGIPLWIVVGLGALMIVALFATFSTLLTREGAQTQDQILGLHRGKQPIAIERTQPVERPYVAPASTRLLRMRDALAEEIAAGKIEVDKVNEWIFVRVADYLYFQSASADLSPEFDELARSIGQTIEQESGPIRVVGHTDSIPPSGRGRYKTNEQLSVARAQSVADVVSLQISDKGRLSVEGKGATEPVADNSTAEGRAGNRRVEVMVPLEE